MKLLPNNRTRHHRWIIFLDFFLNFRTVHFVLFLGITNKCINSYQFIISLSCSYMFRQLCAILKEIVCTFWVTYQFGFLVDKIQRSMWLCVYYVAAWCVLICLTDRSIRTRSPYSLQYTHTHNHILHRILSTKNPNWYVTQKVHTISLKMAHSCRNM
jgi:hypothetical protein